MIELRPVSMGPQWRIRMFRHDHRNTVRRMRPRSWAAWFAQAIEARRVETRSGSIGDESAVGNADAPGYYQSNVPQQAYEVI